MYACMYVCMHVCMYGSTPPDLPGQYHPCLRKYWAEIFTGLLTWPDKKIFFCDALKAHLHGGNVAR